MALTDHEQKMLNQLEQQFKQDDPEFAKVMEPEPVAPTSVLTIVGGVLITIAGFVILFLGVGLQNPAANILVGLSGFAAMVAGLYVATRKLNLRRTSQPKTAETKHETTRAPKQAPKDGYSSAAWWAIMFPWV
ncbi:DUF3040 domain-containing protein [Paenarthrobacter sp. CM16]|uniref:DUF3040 domain-containing protein n=1 Tax=Paenarthrobacter sp. CM16 TaxID=2738447 RepID=UPI0015554A7E|nr:DUF3040 domain-containing protein [Paenarthrobacter sp. CM16]NQD87604.1 DUF3040 domain-containing protein [Paenarthrobacter sp. CM16]